MGKGGVRLQGIAPLTNLLRQIGLRKQYCLKVNFESHATSFRVPSQKMRCPLSWTRPALTPMIGLPLGQT